MSLHHSSIQDTARTATGDDHPPQRSRVGANHHFPRRRPALRTQHTGGTPGGRCGSSSP